ncbi:MAG: VOC family protein [Chloroflexi bacterium]|nr:VOC family protein [Chloroflexota bacterium]
MPGLASVISIDPTGLRQLRDDLEEPHLTSLLNGVNHIALLTSDMDRFIRFYTEVFGAEVLRDNPKHGANQDERMVIMRLGGTSEFNVFQVPNNAQASVQTPMFGRGRLDHFGLNASSKDTFDEIRRRLVEAGASDGTVTDFGSQFSVFFRDPDGLEAEVLLPKDDRRS